jgi:hypothetical protein
MGQDDLDKVTGMLPKKTAMDEEDEEAERKNREEKEAMDRKTAMDSALKTERDNQRGVRVALAKVRPWVGELSADLALDSAADVYRHALTNLGVKGAKELHADALLPVLEAQPKPSDRRTVALAHDAAPDKTAREAAVAIAPGLANIRIGA